MTSINITHIPSSLNSQVALVSHVCQHHVFLRGRKLAVSETVHLQGSRLLVEIFWYPGQHLRKRPLAEKPQKRKRFQTTTGTLRFGMRNSRCGETFIWFSPGKMWPLTTNNLSGCPGGSAKKEPECSCIVALELWQCRGNWCHKNDVSKLIGTGRATSDRDPTY